MNRQILLITSAVVVAAGVWYIQGRKAKVVPQEPAAIVSEVKPEAASKEETKPTTNTPIDVKATFPDGFNITFSDVQKTISELPSSVRKAPFDKIFEAVLSRLVDQRILTKAAESKNLNKDPKVEKQIKDACSAIVQKAELERRVEVMVTPEQKKKKYDELMAKVDKNAQEIAFRMVPFKDAAAAEEALKKVQTGSMKFDDLFKRGGGIRGGGERGYARSHELPEAIWKALVATNKGELASAVQSAEGAHWVVLVDDKRSIVLPKLEEVEKELMQILTPEFAVEVLKALRQEMKAKRFDVNGKELPPEKDEPQAPAGNEKPIDLKKLDTQKVLAKFESGDQVTLQEVLDMRDSLPDVLKAQPLTEELVIMLMDRLLDMRRLTKAAEASKVAETPAVQQRIKEMSPLIIQKAYLEGVIEEHLKAHPMLMKERYEEMKRLWPTDEMEIRLRIILMDQVDQAQKVLADLRSGKIKWEEAVNRYSIDESVKEKAGDVGYVQRKALPEEFANIVFKAAKATLLPDVVRLGDKTAIVRVEDKRAVTPPSFQEMEPNIKREVDAKVAMEHLSKLRQASGVKAFDMDGKAVDLEAVAQRMKSQMEQMIRQQAG